MESRRYPTNLSEDEWRCIGPHLPESTGRGRPRLHGLLRFDDIVSQALIATLCIFLAVYLLYSFRIVKVTLRFATVVIAAMGGFALLYMVVWLLSLFGVNFHFPYAPTSLGMVSSVGIVILGALNLTLDFGFIEQAAAGTPKFMRSYGAYGLMLRSSGSTPRSCGCLRSFGLDNT